MTAFDLPAYTEETFKNVNAASARIEGIAFHDCTFLESNFNESVLQECGFENCAFQSCDLCLVRFPHTRFKGTEFKDCRLLGVNWCNADWETGSLLAPKRVDFDTCLLDHSLFIGLDLTETRFKDSRLHGADFEGADLTRANFHGADLDVARFSGCDLSEADFRGAQGYAINAAHNTLHKTRFSLPEAVSLLHSLDIVLEE